MSSTVTELLQQPGSFEIRLREGTPLAIRESVPFSAGGLPFGHIVVTPQRLVGQILTRDIIFETAVWAGRISGRANRMHTYTGNGLAVWLGDAEDKANTVSSYGGGAPATFTAALTYVLTTAGLGNGLTLGTSYGVTATTNTASFALVPPIDLFNQFAELTGNAWKVNPDGTVDYGAPDTLFRDPPEVVVTREGGGRDYNYSGLRATSIEVTEDFDDYATFAVVTGNGANGLASLASPPTDFGGVDDAAIGVAINSANTTVGTANSAGSAYLALHEPSRRVVAISVDSADIHTFATPGDLIYVHDPDTGMTDSANLILFRGQTLFPEALQLLGYTWPLVPGMGVYTIQSQDTSDAIVDLSDWVDYSTDLTVQFEVGAPPRPAAVATRNDWGKS